jgi:DNA polymerase-1
LIGSLATSLSKHGKVLISSNDKDFAALVNKRIHLLKPKQVEMDEAGVLESYGVRPNQIIDYLMMLGDTVDNIPGINKVGPKTAAAWLTEHGTLKEVLRKQRFTPKMQANIDAAKPHFALTRKLVTIDTSHYADLDPERVSLSGLDMQEVTKLCDKYNCYKLRSTIYKELSWTIKI